MIMECVCGYDEIDEDEGTRRTFIPILVLVNTGNCTGTFERTDKYFPYRHVSAFACPLCGTLKVEI